MVLHRSSWDVLLRLEASWAANIKDTFVVFRSSLSSFFSVTDCAFDFDLYFLHVLPKYFTPNFLTYISRCNKFFFLLCMSEARPIVHLKMLFVVEVVSASLQI